MKRSELRTLVIENTGRSDKTTLINNQLDFAIQKLSRIHPFDKNRPETSVALATGAISVQLPADVDQIITINFADPAIPTVGYLMVLLRKTQFLKMFPNVAGSVVTGRPLYSYRDKDQLYINTKSNGNYILSITYQRLMAFQTDTDECPIFGADEVLVAAATAAVYRSMQMYQDAAQWNSETASLLKLLVIAEEREIGVDFIAKEWKNEPEYPYPNAPWLDPFAGRRSDGGM